MSKAMVSGVCSLVSKNFNSEILNMRNIPCLRWADGPLQPVVSHLLGWIKLKLLNDNSKPVEKLLLPLEICRGSEGFHQP